MPTKLSRTKPTRGSITRRSPRRRGLRLRPSSAPRRGSRRRGCDGPGSRAARRPRRRSRMSRGSTPAGRATWPGCETPPARGSALRRCSGRPRRRSPVGRRRGPAQTRPPRRRTRRTRRTPKGGLGRLGDVSVEPVGLAADHQRLAPQFPEECDTESSPEPWQASRATRNRRRRTAATSTVASTAARCAPSGSSTGRDRPRASQGFQPNSRRPSRSSRAWPASEERTMPPGWKNFSPLYWDGLCEAEIWMPPAAPRSRTRKPSVGVAAGPAIRDVAAVAITAEATAGAKTGAETLPSWPRRSARSRILRHRPLRTRRPPPGRVRRRRRPAIPTRSRSESRPPMSPSPARIAVRASASGRDSRAYRPAPSRGWRLVPDNGSRRQASRRPFGDGPRSESRREDFGHAGEIPRQRLALAGAAIEIYPKLADANRRNAAGRLQETLGRSAWRRPGVARPAGWIRPIRSTPSRGMRCCRRRRCPGPRTTPCADRLPP